MSIFDKKENHPLTQKEWEAAQAKAIRSEVKKNRKAEKEFQKKEGWNGQPKVRK